MDQYDPNMACRKPTHNVTITDNLSGRSVSKNFICEGFESDSLWGFRMSEFFREFIQWNLEEMHVDFKITILNPKKWYSRVRKETTGDDELVRVQQAEIDTLYNKIAELETELENARRT